MTHPLLENAPVGTRFLEHFNPNFAIEYEIVEVADDYYTDLHGNRRGRATDGGGYAYILGSWYPEDDIEIVTPASLYDQVEAMKSGTIFQVGNGAAWMRTDTGVQDLVPIVLALAIRTQRFDDIPERWKVYRGPMYTITILYTPEEDA